MTKSEYNKAYRAKNLHKLKAYMKAYYVTHRTRLIELERKRRWNDPESRKARDRQYYNKHKIKRRANKRAYHYLKRDHRIAYAKKYYALNKDTFHQRAKKWRRDNHAYVLQQNLKYAKAHPDKMRKYATTWRRKNPEKIHARDALRRARELAAKTDKQLVEWFFRILRNQDVVNCTYCGKLLRGIEAHVDHIVPLSRGGDDLPDNYAVSCHSCNSSKNNWLLHEWKRCPEHLKSLVT